MSRIHISIPVRDLARSVRFYRRLLGTGVTRLRDDYANFRLDEPPLHLALVPGDADERLAASRHFGIELPDHATLTLWQDRARHAGLEGRDEPDAACCYARGDKLWLTDPDGNEWEIWVRTGRFEAMAPAEACCAIA